MKVPAHDLSSFMTALGSGIIHWCVARGCSGKDLSHTQALIAALALEAARGQRRNKIHRLSNWLPHVMESRRKLEISAHAGRLPVLF
jgi:hypothetical protein